MAMPIPDRRQLVAPRRRHHLASRRRENQTAVILGKVLHPFWLDPPLNHSKFYYCSAPGNQNSGWFGGLWNKLSLKPKNQMILPDDKNPTIVWDKERKCWTNTEGAGEEVESFKPPPKMSDLGMGGGGGPPLPPPGLAAGPSGLPAGPPSLPAVAAPTFMEPTPSQSIDYTAAPAQPEWLPVAPLPAPSPGLAASPAPANPAATAAAPGGAQPKLQSNMFKMQRNRSKILGNSLQDFVLNLHLLQP